MSCFHLAVCWQPHFTSKREKGDKKLHPLHALELSSETNTSNIYIADIFNDVESLFRCVRRFCLQVFLYKNLLFSIARISQLPSISLAAEFKIISNEAFKNRNVSHEIKIITEEKDLFQMCGFSLSWKHQFLACKRRLKFLMLFGKLTF